MDIDIIINALNEEQEKINKCNDEDELDPIVTAVLGILQRCNYDDNNSYIKGLNKFEKRRKIDGGGFMDNSLPSSSKNLSSLINSLILDLKRFGIPTTFNTKENNSGINIYNNPINNNSPSFSQNLQLTVTFNILTEAFKELSDEQLKELKKLYEEGESKNNIMAKLAEFGKDTASNILANIITNSAFWQMF